MYVIMKDGKYFTGDITDPDNFEQLLWIHHPAGAKVWNKSRSWAQKAADKWGGEVVNLTEQGTGQMNSVRQLDHL